MNGFLVSNSSRLCDVINVPSSETVQKTGWGFPPFAPIFMLIITGSVIFDTSLPTADKRYKQRIIILFIYECYWETKADFGKNLNTKENLVKRKSTKSLSYTKTIELKRTKTISFALDQPISNNGNNVSKVKLPISAVTQLNLIFLGKISWNMTVPEHRYHL